MEKGWIRKQICVALAVLCLGRAIGQPPARQPKTGQISGRITDASGAAIPKAKVFVHKSSYPEDDIRLMARADGSGDFTLTLPNGIYDVLITAYGFRASVRTVNLSPGQMKGIRYALRSAPGVPRPVF